MRFRVRATLVLAMAAAAQSGCATTAGWMPASLNRRNVVSPNPLVVPGADFETVWNKTIQVVDEYFDIAQENRLARTIVTQPMIGATLFEPWRGDSVNLQDRLESTLQTIHRYAKVDLRPAPTGNGWVVKVEVYKELEDMIKPDRQVGGRATFVNEFPVNRTREIVGPVPMPNGWIFRGRDHALEQMILARLREALLL